MWQPENVELGLHGFSLARLGTALLGPALQGQRGPGAGLHFACMVLLAVLTSVLDRSGSTWFTGHPMYTFRTCSQAGLTQGLLALPSLATAIFIATRSWWWQQAARLFVASSLQMLLWLAWMSAYRRPSQCSTGSSTTTVTSTLGSSSYSADSSSNGSGGDRGGNVTLRPVLKHGGAAATRLYLAAAAAGSLLSAASALVHAARPPPPSSPHMLLPGSVFEMPHDIRGSACVLQGALLLISVPGFDHLATDLPRSFTPGEAGILLQALLALLAGSVAYIASALRQGLMHVLWSPHVVQPDPGMHVPAFCMLVLFWVLVLAGCCALALASPSGGRAAGTALAYGGGGSAAKEQRGVGWARGPDPISLQGPGTTEAAAGRQPGRISRPSPVAGVVRQRRTPSVTASAAAPAVQHGDGGGLGSGGSGGSGPAQVDEGVGHRLDALLQTGTRAAAAAGAVLSFGMLVDLAMWVLGRFVAASSQPRLATLAYWFSCLAVAVPFMYIVSKASAAREQQPARLERLQCGRAAGAGSDGPPPAASVTTSEAATATPGDGIGAAGVALWRRSAVEASAPVQSGSARAALLRALAVPHIVMRKGYHLLAILLFLPSFGWDVRMLQASLAVAGAVLVFVEVLRCRGPARARAAIGGFMADFADARDSGPVYVTHFTLLLGIAVPVWLCEPVCGAAAGAMMAGLYGSEAAEPMPMPPNAGPLAPPLSAAAARLLPSCRTVLGLSGLVSLGSGDTAAACVGFLLGRWRLFRGGKKTWEGTLSGAAAMLASWTVVVWWMDLRWALGWLQWGALAVVTVGVSLLEAVTQQLDNVVVPLYYLTHLVLAITGN